MRIKKYYEFREQLINEADEDEFGLGTDEEGADATEDAPEEGGDEEVTDGEEGGAEAEEEEKPFNDNPESYLKNAMRKLQKKIEALFDDEEGENDVAEFGDPGAVIGPEGIVDRSKREEKPKKNKESMTLKDMGAKLESSDIAKSSKTHKSLVVKFTDDEHYYSLYVKVSLKEVLDLIEAGEELNDESVQKAYVKMKKIAIDGFEEVGSLNRNVMMADIDENFIIELKLELDEEDTTGEENEEDDFSIEV